MPKVAATDPPESRRGFIHDHRFLGSNTVIPLIENDAEQFEAVREFLTSNVLSVDIFAVGNGRRLRDRATLGDDAWMPVDRTEPILRAAGTVWVDVVVRNRGVGHKFSAATLDLWDVWLEMLVTDGAGQTVFSSGHLLDKGEVDPTAHFFRNRPMDRHGNRTDKSNRFDTVTVLYDTGIPPGAAEVIHYQFDLPPGVKGPLTLRARLNHRKYTPDFTRWVFGGRPAPGQEALVSSKVDDREWIIDNVPLPRLPITTMAGDVQAIAVTGSEARLPLQAPPGPADALRFNDYGIGLLRQGELLGAEAAFRRVTTLDPSYADGYLNLARVFLRTSRLEEAASMVAAALGCRPGYPKAIFFRAEVALIQGEYERALADFNAVLERYPRDRVVHDRAGRAHYLAGSFDKAIRHFKRILEIDTEERSAYYNLMLCYQAVGDEPSMEAAREKYEEFRPDFSIKRVTAEYRTRHKVESVEVEPLHVHPQ